MPSTMSRPNEVPHAKAPQRRNGKLRVAAILKAGAAVISEKGYEMATMAEIAARSNTKIGSLYRFFPNKEVLANALIAHYHEGVHNAFDELDSRIQSLSISSLADFLLDLMVDLHQGAGPTLKRLLEIPEVFSVKRGEFSRSIHKHIVRTLTLRSPSLTANKAQDMAVVILGNMKTMAAFSDAADQSVRPGAIEELREMTRIYLKSRDEGKKAEEQSRFLAQLQANLNVLPAYTWYASPSGGLTFVNKRTADYLGLPKDNPLRFGIDVGAQWDAHLPFVHPDDREETQENWSTRLRTGEGGEGSFRVRNAQGGYRWFLSRAEPLRASDGTILQWVGVNLDIEDRKCAEQALRESERSARSAIDGIAGLVSVLAPNGELETANRQLLEYFGRSLEWLTNWGTNDAVHPEDLPRVLELFKRGMASGIPFNFDQRLRRFDGEYRWFDNRGVPIRDDSGRIVRWYILLTDIEDRTRALAQLEQMQSDFAHMNRVSMMGELAASLSHEVKQPIPTARNNARAALNFLDKQPPDLGEVREALSCVVGDTDRAGNIIDRIRDHIKKAPPRKEHFDLNEAINEVIEFARAA